MLRPRKVAVLGASGTRRTQGNGVIQNLQQAGYTGEIMPIHPSAESIDGLPAVTSIEALPGDTDLVVVAVPAPGVTEALRRMDSAGLGAAMVFTNGFASQEESDFRSFTATSRIAVHGPNCMGLINFTDATILYPSTITARVKPGKVAIVAQSGSAAISLLNSTAAGLSKVITMGSEFQVTASDYLSWLATDDKTQVIGVVAESIKEPAAFAEAVKRVHDAGKALVVLKVGRSEIGGRAVQAHTGAMISPQDAYDCFFRELGVPTARDYDELAASLEGFAGSRLVPTGTRLAILGISGGETALACDVAAEVGLPVASFSERTRERIKAALKGAAGQNPLDLGATVHHTVEQDREAIDAILQDPGVDMVGAVQDAQATLTPTMLGNYTPRIRAYGEHGRVSEIPLIMVSPSSESTHSQITADLEPCGVPVLRGLRNGLVAMRNMGLHGQHMAQRKRSGAGAASRAAASIDFDRRVALRASLASLAGPVPWPLAAELLAAYGIPVVRSGFAKTAEEAATLAGEIGFPLVLKISSPDIPHRSDVGGVALGIADATALRAALATMLERVRAAKPKARIEGFELQEQLTGWVEAMAGFSAAPPFSALTIVGMGGTMVELHNDKALGLSPISPARAKKMIAGTRLGALLGGYRNLIATTCTEKLASVVSRLSWLATDFAAELAECDINPVLVRPSTGEVRVVDALFVACGSGDVTLTPT